MSCDWHIQCVTCGETLRFDDMNHRDDLMWALIDQAKPIAALAPLVRKTGSEVELATYRHVIDVEWFARHGEHKLVPIDEYGALATQCREYINCACGSTRRCTRDRDHVGDHDTTKHTRRP